MKTVHHLETYDELLHACSDVRQEGDHLPVLTGKLCITGRPDEHPHVTLKESADFTFEMPLNEFLNELSRRSPLPTLCDTASLVIL